MEKFGMLGLALGCVLGLSACGSGAAKPAAVPAPVQTAANTATAAATLAAQAATPATNPLSWVAGTVKSVSDGKVTLQDGSSFTIDPQRPVSRLTPATMADVQPGKVVAITAKRQTDNKLAASLVRILAAAPSPTFFGQSPLDAGNLMTNATVDKVDGSTFTVTFTGGGAQVILAPGGQVATVGTGSASDVKVGATVFAQVRMDGVAQQLSVQ